MKVALVYDRVNKIGGAEKVLLALHEIWPQAPLFTSVYDPYGAPWAAKFKVVPSFLQFFPFVRKSHEFVPFLTPFAFESFSFEEFDVVVSLTSAEAKYILTNPKTLHICYCLTPTRYLWSGFSYYLENPGFGIFNRPARIFFSLVAPMLRVIDQLGAKRPDYYVAISKAVQARIRKYYGQASEVIYPPAEMTSSPPVERRGLARRFGRLLWPASWRASKIKKFQIPNGRFLPNSKFQSIKKEKPYFLVVSRLVPYKKVDLVVKAFNELGWRLKIVGLGNQMECLRKIAHPNIEFLGQVSDEELICYYQNCQALIMACEEDFGIVSLEAQAAGKPVVALASGGVLETVVEGKTGVLFKKQTVKDLKLALRRTNKLKFNPSECKKNATRFSKKNFAQNFRKFVEGKWQQIQQGHEQ